MSRIDTPTMKCDRCGQTTQDLKEMSTFRRIVHYTPGEANEWDLCPPCWQKLYEFMSSEEPRCTCRPPVLPPLHSGYRPSPPCQLHQTERTTPPVPPKGQGGGGSK